MMRPRDLACAARGARRVALVLLAVAVAGCPKLVGFVPGVGTARGVAVSGGLAVVGSDAFGLSVIDVANPAAPVVRGGPSAPFTGQQVALRGSRAVVGGETAAGYAYLWVLDATVTAGAVVRGGLATSIPVGSGQGVQKLVLNGNGTLALAAMGASGMWVVDVSDPALPRRRGSLDTSGIAWGIAINATGTVAYVADGQAGLKVVSLANPSAPSLVAAIAPAGVNYRDVAVAGNFAYVANQNGTLEVFDVGIASAPRRIATRTISGFGLKVAVDGVRAIVVAASSTADLLNVFDVSVPASPVSSRTLSIGPPATGQGISLQGGYAYVASNGLGLRVYDVRTLNPPVGVVDDVFMGQSIAVAAGRAVAVGSWLPSNTVRVRVLDVSVPGRPVVRGDVATTAAPGFTDVALNSTGTLAAVALGGPGLWTVDLVNPAAPRVLGKLDTAGVAMAVALNATASHAFVADGTGGLRVVSLANPAAPTLAATLLPAGANYRGVAVNGTRAYLANQNGTMDVVDVGVPTQPRRIASRTISGFGLDVAAEGTLATVITGTAAGDQMDVLDVTNPAAPVLLRSVSIGAVGTGQAIALSNRRAYVASNGSGLRMYDLTSPSNPVLRWRIPTVGTAHDVALQGGYSYVADFPGTVSVVDLD